jgi:hypothetical protein
MGLPPLLLPPPLTPPPNRAVRLDIRQRKGRGRRGCARLRRASIPFSSLSPCYCPTRRQRPRLSHHLTYRDRCAMWCVSPLCVCHCYVCVTARPLRYSMSPPTTTICVLLLYLSPNAYIYVHVYVCIYMYMYVCIYVCKYIHIDIDIDVYMYFCMYVCVCVCMYVCMYVCIYIYI